MSVEEFDKITIRTRRGDRDYLATYFNTGGGYNHAIREIISTFVDRHREQMSRLGIPAKATDIEVDI